MTKHEFSFNWWKITLCKLQKYFTSIFNNYVLQWNPCGHAPQKDIVIKYLKNENQDLSNQGTSSLKSKHSSESYEKV